MAIMQIIVQLIAQWVVTFIIVIVIESFWTKRKIKKFDAAWQIKYDAVLQKFIKCSSDLDKAETENLKLLKIIAKLNYPIEPVQTVFPKDYRFYGDEK